jgi:hypothetical protein
MKRQVMFGTEVKVIKSWIMRNTRNREGSLETLTVREDNEG